MGQRDDISQIKEKFKGTFEMGQRDDISHLYETENSSPGDAKTGLKHEKELCSGRMATDWGTVSRLEAHVVLEKAYFCHEDQ